MDDDQQYCLRWNNHQSTLISVFDTLLENETLVDCTLAAEGKILKAHKVVLSACSPYFATLLQEQYDKHPVFILKDVKYQELRAMMDYMYRGEVNISQDQLAALLKAAESLQIKGLSDNRAGSSAAAAAPKPEQHLRGKMGTGYTLEQTKRARMATGAMDAQDVSGSREGSSSPSRRRRKVRRRSMENDAHDNSNSSVMQAAASNQLILQQSNAASALVATQMPIAAGVSIAPGSAHTSATGVAGATQGTTQQQVQPLTTTSVNKKTDSAKGITTSISTAAAAAQQSAVQTSEVINTENVQVASGSSQCGAVIVGVEEQDVKSSGDKANHKQKLSKEATTSAGGSEMVIEPKAEYDDEGHEETVEDLTLDDEEIGMEELDQTAGTSQGGEGSSQGYAAWQHDRSQEELLLATQEAQQRDPQDGNAQDSTSHAESRIRVRNWLMLADQSIIGRSNKDGHDSDQQLTNIKHTSNAVTQTNNVTNSAFASTSTSKAQLLSTTTTSSSAATGARSVSRSAIDPKTQTVTRIGSIGRTTIACITPAGATNVGGSKNPLNNGSVDAASAAALAAAGVELDSIDENTTEVIVKIENPDERLSVAGDEIVCNAATEDDNTFDYDLKLSSPVSWSYDCVKIEGEEFEDVSTELDNLEDDDDLLTTAAATTKHAEQSNDAANQNRTAGSGSRQTLRKIMLSAQQQQQLLEQQQHLQHLQLQPTHQALQIKLPTIPATITTIAGPKIVGTAGGSAGGASSSSGLLTIKNVGSEQGGGVSNNDYQTAMTEDKRYRILIQNQRARKESLEHSEDMIYNADIEKPWVCRNCNRTYKWKNSLKCHLKNECGLPPRYFCNKMCGYATNVHSNLKRHLNTKCRDREKEDEKKSNTTYTLVFPKE